MSRLRPGGTGDRIDDGCDQIAGLPPRRGLERSLSRFGKPRSLRFKMSYRQDSSDTLGIGLATHQRMKAFDDSAILDHNNISNGSDNHLLRLSLKRDLVVTGQMLGCGAFSQVVKVYRQGSEDERAYAIKQLKPRIKGLLLDASASDDRDEFVTATVDLGLEAMILSSLNHPHIIKLHAVPSGRSISKLVKTGQFFMMLDYLQTTLDHRILQWKQAQAQDRKQRILSLFGLTASKQQSPPTQSSSSLQYRLQHVALGVASALQHCHSSNIIYRDLKPSNIGFDAETGRVKLFDFGLARECNSNKDKRMTGCTGTPRYMAPEVARPQQQQDYGFPADVYSFSIVLWELVTLQRAFRNITSMEKFHRQVVHRGVRPKVPCSSSQPLLATLLQEGWSSNPDDRPVFSTVCDRLESIIAALTTTATTTRTKPTMMRTVSEARIRRTSGYMRRRRWLKGGGRSAGSDLTDYTTNSE